MNMGLMIEICFLIAWACGGRWLGDHISLRKVLQIAYSFAQWWFTRSNGYPRNLCLQLDEIAPAYRLVIWDRLAPTSRCKQADPLWSMRVGWMMFRDSNRISSYYFELSTLKTYRERKTSFHSTLAARIMVYPWAHCSCRRMLLWSFPLNKKRC